MIQSLLTQEEYDRCAKKYNTYNPTNRNSQEDGSTAPPNWIMGNSLTEKEVEVINARLKAVMKKAGLI